MNAGQKIAKLKTMVEQAGEKLFERVSLAKEVLDDKDWLAAMFPNAKDPEGDARSMVEDECFGDLCMSMSLGQLLQILAAFPTVDGWRKEKFNLRRLWAKLPVPEKERREVHRATVKELEEAKEERKRVEFMLRRSQDEGDKMRAELDRLKEENQILKGRIHELERLLNRRREYADVV